MSICLVALLSGCSKPKISGGIDWSARLLSFDGHSARIIWEAELWENGSGFIGRLEGEVTKRTVERRYLVSNLDFESLVCIEEYTDADTYEKAKARAAECESVVGKKNGFSPQFILAASCPSGVLLGLTGFQESPVLVINGSRLTIAGYRDCEPKHAAVDEFGNCFFISISSGIQRSTDGRLDFAVYSNQTWLTGYVDSQFPDFANTNAVSRSVISSLTVR